MIKIQNYDFEGPFNLNTDFNDVPGIYVIYTNQIWLDVGETDKLGQRINGDNHERKPEWIFKSGSDLISIVFMRVNNQEFRLKIESELRTILAPICGDR